MTTLKVIISVNTILVITPEEEIMYPLWQKKQ